MKTFATTFFLLTLFTASICRAEGRPRPVSSLGDRIYLTEEYYPFNYTEKHKQKGISTDLLRHVWDELDIEHKTIKSMPWARAYERVQRDQNTVLYSMARLPEREDLFLWAGPILTVRFVLIAKKKDSIQLRSLTDLKGYRVGTLRDDISDILLEKYNKYAKIEPVATMDINVSKFLEDRLDMVAYEERSWHRITKKFGLQPDDFETVYILKETPIYYAFHVDTPMSLVKHFQQGLDRVKKSPVYQQILDTYLH